jgi:hypothetical protein
MSVNQPLNWANVAPIEGGRQQSRSKLPDSEPHTRGSVGQGLRVPPPRRAPHSPPWAPGVLRAAARGCCSPVIWSPLSGRCRSADPACRDGYDGRGLRVRRSPVFRHDLSTRAPLARWRIGRVTCSATVPTPWCRSRSRARRRRFWTRPYSATPSRVRRRPRYATRSTRLRAGGSRPPRACRPVPRGRARTTICRTFHELFGGRATRGRRSSNLRLPHERKTT